MIWGLYVPWCQRAPAQLEVGTDVVGLLEILMAIT